MALKVFTSYSKSDESIAAQVAYAIKQAGFTVWFAPDELSGGDRLSAIHNYLEQTNFFIVLLSKSSVNSQWVKHEINVALALYLDGKISRIVPVFIDEVDRPIALADLVSVDLWRDGFQRAIRTILDILQGRTKRTKTFVTQFEEYVDSLITVPDKVAESIQDTAIFARIDQLAKNSGVAKKPRAVDRSRHKWVRQIIVEVLDAEGASGPAKERFLREFDAGIYLAFIYTEDRKEIQSMVRTDWQQRIQCRESIIKSLKSAKVSEHEIMLVLERFDQGIFLPVISKKEKKETKNWLRSADEALVRFAASLWRARMDKCIEIDVDWIADEIRQSQQERDLSKAEWKAQLLASKAVETGLLEPLDEWPQGKYAKPGGTRRAAFYFGPILDDVGRVISAFIQTIAA